VSTTTKRRRKMTTPGKEVWQIIDTTGAGTVLAERDAKTHSEGAVLNLAQKVAEKSIRRPLFIVQLKPLFGEPDVFFRVCKNEDGIVLSYRA
jgi:hypothetical protein